MRRMKTAMDVRIRQRNGPSFQNTDEGIRQVASLRIRGSFALREEVVAELPERYRKALMAMPPKQQEQILSAIEKKVDRKIASGARSGPAANLDLKEQAALRGGTAQNRRDVRKQAIAQKYRLQGKPNAVKINPEMLQDEDVLLAGKADPETWKSDLAGIPPDVRKRLIQRRLSQQAVKKGALGQEAASTSRFMRTVSGAQSIKDAETISEFVGDGPNENRLKGQLQDLERAKRLGQVGGQKGKRVLSDVSRDLFPREMDTRQEQIRRQMALDQARMQEGVKGRSGATSSGKGVPIGPDSRAGPGQNNVSTDSDINIDNISQTDDILSGAGVESYEQFLLSSARTKAQKAEIQKALRRTASGRATRETERALQGAALRAAYAQRNVSGAYKELLAGAGFTEGGEKAAAQLAYQKQIRKVLKNEYRKQLIGKLSKLKTTSLIKALQKQKAKQELFQEDEQNRAQSEQFRQSFGLMSKGRKMLKKLAEDARKAVKALLTKKLPLMIIPVLMAVLIPLLATLMPIFSTLTATSYQDNEVYAYADATELIEYAKSWIGKIPYVWAGGHGGSPTAWQSGCDCSGFVHGVFNHFGYEIGGDTGAMESQAGTHIAYDSLAQARPGDVLIYYRTAAHVKGDPNGSGSTHVSIYLGNNQIIHQSGGVHISNEYHQYLEVRRVLTPDVGGRGNIYGGLGGMGTYGHKIDATNYSQSDLELIWAIVAQEDNGSYKGALAVISAAMNRVESPKWSYEGKNALAQLTAPGQFCYSNDTYWQARLGGNVPDYVKQAVNDCLKKGKRNHNHTSFRSTKGKVTGDDAVQIGGNWFFDY